MNPVPHVIAVIPVHNRRDTTLRCLRHLRDGGEFARLAVFVVDDGSTDGTAAAIAAEFPAVRVVPGSGDLFWTGAIELGTRRAIEAGADFVLWLNDDSLPDPGALALLIETSRAQQAIAGGVCYLPQHNTPSYGGFHRGWCRLGPMLSPGPATIPCAALSGNLVCVPRSAVEEIGYPDGARLPHGFGDIDYTLRAHDAGIPVLLVGAARGHAQPNLSLNYRSWMLSDVPLREWWRHQFRRGSFSYQPAQWRFYWRHWHIAGALYCAWMLLKLALISLLRLLVPQSLLRKWHGHRSAAWQHEQANRPPPAKP